MGPDPACLWDGVSGKQVRVFPKEKDWTLSVQFSPDGKSILTGAGTDRPARLWNAATAKLIRAFDNDDDGWTVTVRPDGTIMRNRAFGGPNIAVAALSPNGKQVLGVDFAGKAARIWDVGSGKPIRTLQVHEEHVMTAAYSADGKRLLTGSFDGTTRLWDAASGRELCRLLSFRDGSWAVIDPAGRYDADAKAEHLYWVVGNRPVAFERFRDRFYDPGLLGKCLRVNKEPLRRLTAED